MYIIEYQGKKYGVYHVKHNEDIGSTCYDRTYQLIDLDRIPYGQTLREEELSDLITVLPVKGVTKLPFIELKQDPTINFSVYKCIEFAAKPKQLKTLSISIETLHQRKSINIENVDIDDKLTEEAIMKILNNEDYKSEFNPNNFNTIIASLHLRTTDGNSILLDTLKIVV